MWHWLLAHARFAQPRSTCTHTCSERFLSVRLPHLRRPTSQADGNEKGGDVKYPWSREMNVLAERIVSLRTSDSLQARFEALDSAWVLVFDADTDDEVGPALSCRACHRGHTSICQTRLATYGLPFAACCSLLAARRSPLAACHLMPFAIDAECHPCRTLIM
jgi:hypothetical protein